MSRARSFARILWYFFAVIVVFSLIFTLTSTNVIPIRQQGDLVGFDFCENIAYINDQCYDWYPDALYTPEDFAEGSVAETPSDQSENAEYYTYRMILELVEGKVYGLSAYSATHAQMLWIDGTLYSSIGMPGERLENMVPMTEYYTVYFPGREKTEIIIQRSNFVHAQGGRLFPQYIGEQSLISALTTQAWVRGALVVGTMLMSALFFFGLFLFFIDRRNFLWFSIACLLIAIRTLFTDHIMIMVLIPNLDWNLSLKIEYIANISFFFFFFLYINNMFGRKLSRFANLLGLLHCLSTFLLVLFTPSTVYTKFLPHIQIGALIYVMITVAALVAGVIRERKFIPENGLILFGTMAYAIFAILDLARYSYAWEAFRSTVFTLLNMGRNHHYGGYEDLNLMQTGMMVFVFANTLALALSFTRTELELDRVRQSEREMEQANRMLERLNRIKSDFLGNISHEMRTPLTVIGGYAGLTLRQMRKGTVDSETEENLDTIQREAVRLGNMVEQLKSVSQEKERETPLIEVDAKTLFERAAFFCTPICQKNGNQIDMHTDPDSILLHIDADGIFQVLFNLITNANRHTKNSTISLYAEHRRDVVHFQVRDHGDGIESGLLSMAFMRGVSGDGGTGLGLAICKEIIEEHGGSIEILSTLGEGTTVIFTLPHR